MERKGGVSEDKNGNFAHPTEEKNNPERAQLQDKLWSDERNRKATRGGVERREMLRRREPWSVKTKSIRILRGLTRMARCVGGPRRTLDGRNKDRREGERSRVDVRCECERKHERASANASGSTNNNDAIRCVQSRVKLGVREGRTTDMG